MTLPSRNGDYVYELLRPAQPAIESIPAKREYVAVANWDSGAVSIPIIEVNGGYKWQVNQNVVAAVVGLAEDYAGSGYSTIDHGILFSRGTATVFNNGVAGDDLGSFTASDVFTLGRSGGNILTFKNGVLIHTEPSKLYGVFRLAASIYLSENTVDNAELAKLSMFEGAGGGEGVIPRVVGFGSADYTGIGNGVIRGVTSQAEGLSRGSASGALPHIEGLGGGAYSSGSGVLPALASNGNDGELSFAIATGDGVLPYVEGSARGVGGEIASGYGTAQKMVGAASNRQIGTGSGVLPTLGAYGGIARPVSIFGGVIRGFSVQARASVGVIRGLNAVLPAPRLRAVGGATLGVKIPGLKLQAAGANPVVARARIGIGRHRLSASGLTGAIGGGVFSVKKVVLTAHGGGVAAMVVTPRVSLVASGVLGAVGRAMLKSPRVKLHTAASLGVTGKATIALPSLQPAPRGHAWLVAPSFTLVASGGEIIEASYEAYSINITTGAVTRYTNFAFDNVLRFGNRFFGVRADGVYELAGETDNGEPVIAQVRTFNTDFGRANLKRVPFLYIVGETGTDLQVGFQADRGVEYKYPVGLVSTHGVQTSRVKAGLGVKGTYYNFSLTNAEGQSFQIDRFEAVVDTTTVVKG